MLELTLYGLDFALTMVGVFFVIKLGYAFEHFKPKRPIGPVVDLKDLPSVSVCIPARNEAHAMTQCLERVIASNYPKLEIIVLDDSSADDTSFLIKSFAHAGVRFVEGARLPTGWLGKNYALEGLLGEASGSFVLYMDVDTQLAPDTIGQLVAFAASEAAAMVSVLPRRQDGWRLSLLLGSLRYYWELMLHRRSAPAVASGAWLINRRVLLDELGGFASYKNDIQPEAKLAAKLLERDGYRFIIGTPELGVSYEKKWSSQVDTSIRLLYPLLGGRLAGNLLALVGLCLLNLPSLVLLIGLFDGWGIIQTVATWQLCVFGALYGLYLDRVWQKGWWLGLMLWPVVIAQEAIILGLSIGRYRSHRVNWKGRPITAIGR